MITLPQRIRTAFLRLKKQSSQYIEIKHIKDYFFVYQSTSRWDKKKKKPIKVPLYLGRITNAGEFIPAKKKKPRINALSTTQIIEQPVLDLGQKKLEAVVNDEKRSKHEPTLLTALSMNGRISMSVLGKIVGLKETAVSSQVKKLERKYGIKYMAEIDTTKLGYIQFLITVKFLDISPTVEELKNVLSKEARIQLAFITKGDWQLAIYALAKDSIEMTLLIVEIRKKINYKSIWITTTVDEDYGFIPVRPEFIDLVKEKLFVREYAVLKELIIDGKRDFSAIDRKYNFDRGRSQYSYYRLKERGIIKRTTISMENLQIKYIGIIVEIFIDYLDKFIKNRGKSLMDIIRNSTNNLNRYLLVEDISNPDGSLFYLPVFNDGDLESAVEEIFELDLGTRVKTLIITNILVGKFCYRLFDNAHSLQQEILVKTYKAEPVPKIDYEETGRTKKERKSYTDIRGLKPE